MLFRERCGHDAPYKILGFHAGAIPIGRLASRSSFSSRLFSKAAAILSFVSCERGIPSLRPRFTRDFCLPYGPLFLPILEALNFCLTSSESLIPSVLPPVGLRLYPYCGSVAFNSRIQCVSLSATLSAGHRSRMIHSKPCSPCLIHANWR